MGKSRWIGWLAAGATCVSFLTATGAAQPSLYEMRWYEAEAPDRLEKLNNRFRDHAMKLFEKHGMTNLGYFVPLTGKDDKPNRNLVVFLGHKDHAAREASWKAFLADPDYRTAHEASEKGGGLIRSTTSTFLVPTDYSPMLKVENRGGRVFELRTYTAKPGTLAALDSRFRDHTMTLFAKHGMTNLVYWHLAPDSPQADRTLIYLLAHASHEAAEESFTAFRDDPDWIKAKTESEERAGGSLTEGNKGVISQFLVPTEYSPWK